LILHEAARPFVRISDFKKLIEYPAANAIYGIPINFTVVKADDKLQGLLKRDELRNVQLPQKFDKKPLLEAHEWAKENGYHFTEDASMLYAFNQQEIAVLEGTPFNIKITNPVDFETGEIIYQEYINKER